MIIPRPLPAVALAVAVLLAGACGASSEEPAPPPPGTSPGAPESPGGSVVLEGTLPAVTDELLIADGQPDPCGAGFRASLAVFDTHDGDLLWQHPTPWAPDGPALLGDGVVAVVGKHTDDEIPPSVAALDVRSGQVVWQTFLDAERAELIAADGQRLAVNLDDRLHLVDATGTVTDTERTGFRRFWNELGPRTGTSAVAVGPGGVILDPFADRGPVDLALGGELAGHLQAIDGDRLVFADGDRVGLVERDTATTWTSPPLPLDTEFSEVVDVRIGEELALVAIGSEVGPNRRLVVLERASGRIRWTLDGIRTADETRGRVIYDRRNPDVLPEGLSRDVFVVDAHDPSRVIWSAPSKGDLGGFIAPLDDADVFIHRDPAIWPRAPYPTVGAVTEVQIFDPELILVSGAGTEVEELRGGDSDLRDDRRLIVADGDRMVVLLGGALHVAGRSPMTIPIDMASGGPIGLLAHENVTIVAFGRPEIGCH